MTTIQIPQSDHLLSIIDTLPSDTTGQRIVSRGRLARLFGLGEQSVTNYLAVLQAQGYVRVQTRRGRGALLTIQRTPTPRLLPCPFCGKKAQIKSGRGTFWVACVEGCADGAWATTEGQAGQKWNRRAEVQQ